MYRIVQVKWHEGAQFDQDSSTMVHLKSENAMLQTPLLR